MKKLSVLILSVLLIVEVFAQATVFPFIYNGKSYEVVMIKKTWEEASEYAVARNGYLVEINDQEEQDAVYDAITNGAEVDPYYTFVGNGGSIAYIWIGATDKNEEGTWLWDGDGNDEGINYWIGEGVYGSNDGAPVDEIYNNWGGTTLEVTNEPDNWGAGQDYGAIGLSGWPSGSGNLGSAGEWNDIRGSSSIYFVVEYDFINTDINSLKDNEINVYPNPTDGIIKVNAPMFESIQLFDITGKSIENYNTQTIDLSNLQSGVYYIQIKTKNSLKTRRIILE